MKSYRSAVVIVFISIFFSIGCSGTSVPPPSSSAGALTANSAISNPAPRPFERHNLDSGNYLSQFIRPDIRAKLDEEPTGDSDASYDPSVVDTGSSSDQTQSDLAGEGPTEDAQQHQTGEAEESFKDGARLDTLKFAWARATFGDAVKSSPTNTGVIVVYADENYYELERLMAYVEEGRDKIAEASKIGSERVQVVFGGYRATPQIEMWIVPQCGPMTELKPDERPKAK